jgi:hypothetical protein
VSNPTHLHGSWQLEAFEVDDGTGLRPWRPPASGLLLYNPDGTMAVAINGTPSPGAPALTAMLFYAGDYVVARDERGLYVEHHVQQSTEAARLGKVLRREVSLDVDAGVLELTGERPDGLRSWLRWRKRRH